MTPINFHFQLDPSKPDEQRAIMLLEEWQRSGWNVQKILVMGLLSLGNARPMGIEVGDNKAALEEIRHMLYEAQDQSSATLHEAHNVLLKVQELLENAQFAAPTQEQTAAEKPREAVSDEFVASVKKAIKPGIQLD